MDRSASLLAHGRQLYDVGRLEEAEVAVRTATELAPDDVVAAFLLGHILMALGRWREGWPLLERRMVLRPDNAARPGVAYPEWTGESLEGRRLLVWCEQGLGDQIMMARFLAELRRRAAKVTAVCWAPVAPLFEHLADEVVATAPNTAIAVKRHDLWTRWFSIPYRLGITPETVPTAPYLKSSPGSKAGVGLMWQTNSTTLDATRKSLPEDLGAELMAAGLIDLAPEKTAARDFADTARIIDGLDAVVTIDTSVAHLTGAMGKRTLLMLPATKVDWRWGPRGERSNWYPSIEMIRQPEPGDWNAVVDEVRRRL